MSLKKIEILERTLERERKARKVAEKILEDKSRDLYFVTQKLKQANIKLENLLAEKSSTLNRIFKNLNDAYLLIDLQGNVIEMNQIAVNLFGYDVKKEKINVSKIIYKDDIAYAKQSFSKLYNEGAFNGYTTRVLTKNKEIKWLQINGTLLYDKEKKPFAAQGIIRDITKQKKAADLLLESENRLSSLILNLDSGVLLENEKREIVLTNTKFCEIFKIPVSPNLLVGQDCSDADNQNKHLFSNPKDFIKRLTQILKNKKQVLGDELLMVDGTVLERDFIPILKGDKYQGHLWTYRDVTLKRQHRKSLEVQKEKYSNIIANMNLGLLEVDVNDTITFANNSFCKMSGYSKKELIGKVAKDVFVDAKDKVIIKELNQKRAKGESNSYEIKIKDKKGNTKTWLISGAPNYNVNGELIGSIGIHLDITKLKELEQQKVKILKELENSNQELQEYAHIVSHDLKSPLRSINALVSWIKEDNKDVFDEMTLENFNLIDTTLETMEKLIFDVLEYASVGSETHKTEIVDLNEVLQKLKKVLYVPENITIRSLNTLPTIKGDATKLQQLFQNFISNAIKFCDKEKGLIEVHCVEKPTYYQFSIKDNGIGIEKKYHDKIFQVFHSLNKRKDSTGIGLSIVKKIVDLYEGDIWLESAPNKGTTFYFTLKK